MKNNEKIFKVFKDIYGNIATIIQTKGLPFQDAPERVDEFTLTLYATYDNNKVYFLSIFESLEDAKNKLKQFSCGKFEEV